jgi:uncharacterized membrane protein
MDIGIIAAIAMLVLWVVANLMGSAPGWIHLLLTAGVFLLIWRIVKVSERAPRS